MPVLIDCPLYRAEPEFSHTLDASAVPGTRVRAKVTQDTSENWTTRRRQGKAGRCLSPHAPRSTAPWLPPPPRECRA